MRKMKENIKKQATTDSKVAKKETTQSQKKVKKAANKAKNSEWKQEIKNLNKLLKAAKKEINKGEKKLKKALKKKKTEKIEKWKLIVQTAQSVKQDNKAKIKALKDKLKNSK